MKHSRGYSVIEVLLVVAIALALGGLVSIAAARAEASRRALNFSSDLTRLADNLREHYRLRESYVGLSMASARSNALLPVGVTMGLTPWGTEISLAPTSIADPARGTDVASANSGFAITWTMASPSTCVDVLNSVAPHALWLRQGGQNLITPTNRPVGTALVLAVRQSCDRVRTRSFQTFTWQDA